MEIAKSHICPVNIPNIIKYLESKADYEMCVVVAALEKCKCCESDRFLFYDCLLKKGKLSFEQKGISKQAVRELDRKNHPMIFR